MGRSGQNKEKHGKSGEVCLDDCNDGGAARTRPLSFDEIMNRRKIKDMSEIIKEDVMVVGNIPGQFSIENVPDDHESGRSHRHNKDSSPGVVMHALEEHVKVGSEKEEDKNTLTKSGDSSRRRDREGRESETKFKQVNSAKSNHRRSLKSEIRLKDRSPGKEEGRGTRGSKTLLKAEVTKETSSKVKGKSEKLIPSRGRIGELSFVDSRDEATKKHSRDLTGRERNPDRSGEKSERKSKRKHRNGDDEKNKDKSAAKKVDLGKGRDLKVSDRKERKESPKSRHGELRIKKKRSRSREREDRNRRSISLSPRAQKHTSYYLRENEELPSHSSKGRSGRQHSDIDRSIVTSNGSSGHYRRQGGSSSGLGGYSPRKRKTEAAVKTPSPVNRSPEKKNAKWDIAPVETYSISSNVQMSNQTASSSALEGISSDLVTLTTGKPLAGTSVGAYLAKLNVAIDSVELTQANRPMRRLYIENLPAAASEKALMEFLNNSLLSSGVSHIHGSPPCINCVIQREKSQALVEFLTAEDASAALACDGCSFSGCILKITRPKDFVEVAKILFYGAKVQNLKETSVSRTLHPNNSLPLNPYFMATYLYDQSDEAALASADSISDIVKDSPNKIFIGGISKTLQSKMVMEIASAFGPLKSYHNEVNEDIEEQCAFLEYKDESVTLKAIAGLNGMKVGGQVLTAVQAVLDGSTMDNSGNPPFYGIPEHALPLLKKPTEILKLKNVFNSEAFSSLSELEVEEVLEDVRLECARFGAVKSVNIVKCEDSLITTAEACGGNENLVSAGVQQILIGTEGNEKGENVGVGDHQSTENTELEFQSEPKKVDAPREGDKTNVKHAGETMVAEPSQQCKLDTDMAAEDVAHDSTSDIVSLETPEQLNTLKDDSCHHDDEATCYTQMEDVGAENRSSAEEELNIDEAAGQDRGVEMQSHAIVNGDNEKRDRNLELIFEPGCVFVEFRRTEASCMAAHCLHGRLFDDRIVTIEYVPLDLYRARFPK